MSGEQETITPSIAKQISKASSIDGAITRLERFPQNEPIPESSVDGYTVENVVDAFRHVRDVGNDSLPESVPRGSEMDRAMHQFTSAGEIRKKAAHVIAEEFLDNVNDEGFVIHYLINYKRNK